MILLTSKFHLKNPCQIFDSVSSCVWGILLSSQWGEKSITEWTDRIRFTDYYWDNLDFTLEPEFLENSICFFVVLWKVDSDTNHDLVRLSSPVIYSQWVSDFEKALSTSCAETHKSNLSSIAPQCCWSWTLFQSGVPIQSSRDFQRLTTRLGSSVVTAVCTKAAQSNGWVFTLKVYSITVDIRSNCPLFVLPPFPTFNHQFDATYKKSVQCSYCWWSQLILQLPFDTSAFMGSFSFFCWLSAKLLTEFNRGRAKWWMHFSSSPTWGHKLITHCSSDSAGCIRGDASLMKDKTPVGPSPSVAGLQPRTF